MGRKREALPPRRKRMLRAARLASAKDTRWVESYVGRDIVRGYARWYGVDLVCAVIELRLLGVPVTAEREEQARHTVAVRAARRAAWRQERELRESVEKVLIDNDLPCWGAEDRWL